MPDAITPALATSFALEYVKDLNATRAYLAIRPKTKQNSAATLGSRMLRRVEVQQEISRLRLEELGKISQEHDRLRIDAASVLRELAICGYSDYKDYVANAEIGLDLTEEAKAKHPLATRAVQSVKVKRELRGETIVETVEYKLHPKVESLKLLGQHLGILGQEKDPPGSVTMTWRYVAE
jgi:phage terminase small subunit